MDRSLIKLLLVVGHNDTDFFLETQCQWCYDTQQLGPHEHTRTRHEHSFLYSSLYT